MYQSSFFSTSSPALVIFWQLPFLLSKTIACCSFDVHALQSWYWEFFRMFVGHFYFFFWEALIRIICPLLKFGCFIVVNQTKVLARKLKDSEINWDDLKYIFPFRCVSIKIRQECFESQWQREGRFYRANIFVYWVVYPYCVLRKQWYWVPWGVI